MLQVILDVDSSYVHRSRSQSRLQEKKVPGARAASKQSGSETLGWSVWKALLDSLGVSV